MTGSMRGALAALCAATLAATLAACGGNGGTPASAGPANSAQTDACKKAVASFLEPYAELPKKLSSDLTELPDKPSPGGTIIQLANGNVGGDVATGPAIEDAAKQVNWTFKQVLYDGSPEDLNAKYKQVIDQHPNAISVAGPPVALYAQQVATAQSKGIITVASSGTETPSLTKGPQVVLNGLKADKRQGELNAFKFLDSVGCRPTALLVVNVNFPALNAAVSALQDTLKRLCPGCHVTVKLIQASDLGTPNATSATVAALQASAGTKWVYATIGNVADGLEPALATAGLNDVKVFGQVPDNQSVAALHDGTNAWWVTQSPIADGWAIMHLVLLATQTGKTIDATGQAYGYMTPANIPADAKEPPMYPTDYREQFRSLWHLGA